MLLEDCGSVDKLESLQNYENSAIAERATRICERYLAERGNMTAITG